MIAPPVVRDTPKCPWYSTKMQLDLTRSSLPEARGHKKREEQNEE